MASKHRAELVARFRSRLGFKSVPSALKAFSSPLLSSNLLEQSIAKMWVIDRVPPEPEKRQTLSFKRIRPEQFIVQQAAAQLAPARRIGQQPADQLGLHSHGVQA